MNNNSLLQVLNGFALSLFLWFLPLISAQAREAETLELREIIYEFYGNGELTSGLSTNLRAQFDREMQEYDELVGAYPHDIPLQIDRCKYVSRFSSQYEYADGVEFAYDAFDGCENALLERFGWHPEVKLWSLERSYGDDWFSQAQEIELSISPTRWNGTQRGRLYTLMARHFWESDPKRAGFYAERALQSDASAGVRDILARAHIAAGREDDVLRVLQPLAESLPQQEYYELQNLMELYATVGAKRKVEQIYGELSQREHYSRLTVARFLASVGLVNEASREFDQVPASVGYSSTYIAFEKFRFAFEWGTAEQAFAAYTEFRDSEIAADPFAINRLQLLGRHSALPWTTSDFLRLFNLLLLMGALALIVAIPLSFVHYRGLALLNAGRVTKEYFSWKLSHAWWGLFVLVAASLATLVTVGPINFADYVAEYSTYSAQDTVTDGQIARAMMVSSGVLLAGLAPLAYKSRVWQPNWLSSHWPLWLSIGVGLLLGVVFRIPVIAFWNDLPDISERLHQLPSQLQSVLAIRDSLGWAAAAWLVVLVAPVTEEFLFRGVMLISFQRFLGFRWANFIQALVFALLHFSESLRMFAVLFAVGLVAGKLAQKSGGLLSPMVFHAVFNGILVAYLFS